MSVATDKISSTQRTLAGLLDRIDPEAVELLAGIAGKVLNAAPEERTNLLRKAALAVGYEHLAEASMDAALKAAKKI